MGSKVFINQTGYNLSVQIEVRKGSDPSATLNVQNFSLAVGQILPYTYSDRANPYLNGMAVNAANGESVIAEQQFIFKRGTALDDGFNKNDTVIIGMTNQNITISFQNS